MYILCFWLLSSWTGRCNTMPPLFVNDSYSSKRHKLYWSWKLWNLYNAFIFFWNCSISNMHSMFNRILSSIKWIMCTMSNIMFKLLLEFGCFSCNLYFMFTWKLSSSKWHLYSWFYYRSILLYSKYNFSLPSVCSRIWFKYQYMRSLYC